MLLSNYQGDILPFFAYFPPIVSLAYGMCVPNIACASLTCEEIQRQIPSSAGVDLDDCSVRCCEEDLCNDPDVDPVSPSSSPETLTVSTSGNLSLLKETDTRIKYNFKNNYRLL